MDYEMKAIKIQNFCQQKWSQNTFQPKCVLGCQQMQAKLGKVAKNGLVISR